MKIRIKRTKPLIVVGGGGLGREVIWLVEDAEGPYRVIGVLDDAASLRGRVVYSFPVLGGVDNWRRHTKAEFILAIGAPRSRHTIARRMHQGGTAPKFATLVHPSARMSSSVRLGEGTVVAAGAILTTEVRIGRHCILDRMVNVGHDCVFGDFCTVSPLAPVGGNVSIGNGVWIGAGASVRQGVSLASGSMVGMGAVVVKDVKANELVVGTPAKLLRHLDKF